MWPPLDFERLCGSLRMQVEQFESDAPELANDLLLEAQQYRDMLQ
jgi:hypothetical protein